VRKDVSVRHSVSTAALQPTDLDFLRVCMVVIIQGGPKKRGHKLMTIILSNLNRFNNFLTGRFPGKFAVKWILKIPPPLAFVATLRCETLMSAKQA